MMIKKLQITEKIQINNITDIKKKINKNILTILQVELKVNHY